MSELARGRRTRICLSCRTLLDDGESCPGNQHRTVSLLEAKGQRRLDDEVWGPDSRARKMRQSAKAGAGGAGFGSIFEGCDLPGLDGCDASGEAFVAIVGIVVFALAAVVLYWIVRALVRFVREAMDRPKPHGALLPPPRPNSRAVTASGVVRAGKPLSTPWKAGSAFAYAMELHRAHVFGGGAMLRDAAAAGFEVLLDDGRVLRVPEGRIRIAGRLENVELEKPRLIEGDRQVVGRESRTLREPGGRVSEDVGRNRA